MKKYNKSNVITHELLLAIDLVDVLLPRPLHDHHEGGVIVIHYEKVLLLLLLLKLIIKRNLPSYFLLLVQTFLLRQMSN
jgi:hypothetical protein